MFIRKLHTVPKLAFESVPGLFSKEAMDVAWTKHQTDILKRLSAASVDTDNATRIPFHIALNAARRYDSSHVFNYASQAHNNHLFFQSVAPSATATKPSSALEKRIERQYGNCDNLINEFKKFSEKVVGNGWVFLIETPDKQLQLIAANNAGTPYHHARQQAVDLNTVMDEDSLKTAQTAQELVAANTKNYNICLLALNLWQHAYLVDFGVAGREAYIDAWAKAINWNTVSTRLYGEQTAA